MILDCMKLFIVLHENEPNECKKRTSHVIDVYALNCFKFVVVVVVFCLACSLPKAH